VLEAALGLATGDEQVAVTKLERARPPASLWAEQERSWLAE
jgi:hypothetical protein